MKNIFSAAFAALLIICTSGCTKESPLTSNSVPSASNLSNTVKATGSTVGRQLVVSMNTGSYYQPTTQALLWLPTTYYSKSKSLVNQKYPLIISLGGVGQNGSPNINILLSSHTIASRISDGWDATTINANGNTCRFIVFSPTDSSRGSWGWSAPAIKVMLEQLKSQYRVDESRIYITGLSAGGWGMWSCITDDTSLCKQFAAIGPVSSAGSDHPDKITNVNKYNIACWNICGTADSFYGLAVSYTNIINSNNPTIPCVLTCLNGVGHSAWVQAYNPNWTQNGINFYQWLLKYHK